MQHSQTPGTNQKHSTACRWRRVARKHRCGAAVLEFAAVAPVLFVLVFGMLEFGRMVMVQQMITNAAREGARIAIVPGSTTSSVTTAVSTYLTGASISGATTTVSPEPSSATYGATITVTVSVPYTSVSWVPSPYFLGATTLTANCIMRTEQSNSSGS
jgi:Flp pilus assembly protein TadG